MEKLLTRFLRYPIFFAALVLVDCSPNSNPTTGTRKYFDSGTLSPGMQFSHVFNEIGVVTYFCAFHSGMTGTINVHAGGVSGQDTVYMNDFTFDPSALTIDIGQSVIWINRSGLDHTATSDK